MLLHRLMKGHQRMGGRREAELAIGLEPLPLLEEIEHHRMAACPCEASSMRALHQHIGKAGHALDALVGRRHHHVDVRRVMSSGSAPNDDMASTMNMRPRCLHHAGQCRAIGLTMPDVVSQWMIQTWLIDRSASSMVGDLLDGRCRAVALVDLDDRAADLLENLRGAVAIGAIGDDQRLGFVLGRAEARRVPPRWQRCPSPA